MNDLEVLTKNITIIVRLDGYDYDHPEDVDVIIEAGGNETKVFTISKLEIRRLSTDLGIFRIYYEALHYFKLDSLKITCKYPVTVRCDDFTISKYIEPTTDNKRTQVTLMNGAGDTLELEGTEKQIEDFEAERKERNDLLFPSAISYMKTAELALEHGLTVKKVITRE